MLDRSIPRLSYLDDVFMGRLTTQYSERAATAELVATADMVIGAVLIPGAAAPKLVTRAQLGLMKPGSALVDVAIDQGGCFETSHPTTHDHPVYEIDGVLHYCVANMPGAVPLTSTLALTNATLPYALTLADKGWQRAALDDPGIGKGINMVNGQVTCRAVAEAFGLSHIPLETLLPSS